MATDHNDDGYCLSYRNDLGRVLIATKNYNIGDIVLKEKPLVVYKSLRELFYKVTNELSSKDKDLLYDMHHRDFQDNPPMFEECKNLMNESLNVIDNDLLNNFLNTSGISMNDIHKILHISNFNSHKFIGSDSGYRESTIDDEPNRTALFYLGSKVAHSCEPNCIYTSKLIDGTNNSDDFLAYIAIRPIKVGDIISFSYINPIESTEVRRTLLRRSKDFFCECQKCIDYDYNSGLRCKVNGCKGYKYMIKPHLTSEGKWHCQLCSNDDDPIEFLSCEIELRLTFNNLVKNPGALDKAVEKHITLISNANKFLSPTHNLIINVYLELSKIYASIANSIENKFGNHEVALQSRLFSVVSHLKAISLIECANEKCQNGLDCMVIHQPYAHIAAYALWSFMDIMHVISSKSTKFTSSIHFYMERLQMYIPFLKLEYGNKDPDVLSIVSLYNEQYQSNISTNHNCRNKFCFERGTMKCSKCLATSILFCSKDCFTKCWKYHRNNECKCK